ncbi:DUF397 domain-containing protein [Streptomyces kunmingensis]|uniref:DUF397 domain-containing protein n=1 Tax=Streptomyces kunmingensis TaxID=68225 RepID=A0ABU6CNH4_9ACTN|nr:DUF397 domain-containing protein [Streptomyces kunmingensis]MEB3966207.1 DUF397 domain-containing protein [Streptomyces kunmingensis]
MSMRLKDSPSSGIDREKELLYSLDLSGVQWRSAPGSPVNGPVEVAALGDGGVAMRNPADPRGLVLRFTSREWEAFKLGALHGEFD